MGKLQQYTQFSTKDLTRIELVGHKRTLMSLREPWVYDTELEDWIETINEKIEELMPKLVK